MDRLPSDYLHMSRSAKPRYREERPTEEERALPPEERLRWAVWRWCQEFGYMGFHGALAAARDALDDGDPEVSVLLVREAKRLLDGTAENARQREERLRKLGRRIGPDSRVTPAK